MPKLNGWQRLWVLGTVGYLVVVAVVTANGWPTRATWPHSDRLLVLMPADSRAKLGSAPTVCPEAMYKWLRVKGTGDDVTITPAIPNDRGELAVDGIHCGGVILDPGQRLSPLVWSRVEMQLSLRPGPVTELMPNGHRLEFPPGTPSSTVDRVSRDYMSAIDRSLASERWQVVGWATASWLIPSALVYDLGWTVGWVARGFRKAQ
jgi:hypothetical protein